MKSDYLEEWANTLRADMDKATISDKVIEIQKQIALMQDEIKSAELSIQSLINDKASLRSALSSVVKKKDQLFRVLLDHKEALQAANEKILELQSALDEVNLVSSEIDKVKKQLVRRDDQIKKLKTRNRSLESIIEHQGIEGSVLKKMYKNKIEDIDPDPKGLSAAVDAILKKVKSNKYFHRLFKACIPCINSFQDLIDNGKIEYAFTVICKFCNELMKDDKNNPRDLSLAVSEIQHNTNSLNGTTNQISFYGPLDDEYLGNHDDERISRLNSELKNIIANSESLLSKSYSKLRETDINNSKEEQKSFSSNMKERFLGDNLFKRIAEKKYVPKVEIKRPAGKVLRATPKQSILRKSDN